MLVIFLILFTKILADSDEDKYVDLLPDAEKQQFIEKVARRILKDVASQETGKTIQSGELSEEQLIKHNEFVKAILKQEADFVRRSKGEPTKDGGGKSESEEKDNLAVKPLVSEKVAVPDDSDLDRVDLTLRHDRREIGYDDNSTEFIKVEIVTDAVPKIKRSVPNTPGSASSESEDSTSETYEKTESNTEKLNEVKITTEKYENAKSTIISADVVITTTKEPEMTTLNLNTNKPNNGSLVSVESITNNTDHKETKNIISKSEESKDPIPIESTTSGNGGIGQTEPKNDDSSESDEEILAVKGLNEPTRRYKDISNETTQITVKSDIVNPETEHVSVKAENKDDTKKSNSVSTTSLEGLTTLVNKESTTTNNILTHNLDTFTELSSSTYIPSTENSINTLTSTLTVEKTTDTVTKTTSYSPSTENYTTETSSSITTESTTKTVELKTEEPKIIVEDFTSKPTNKSVDSVTSTIKSKKESNKHKSEIPNESKKVKPSKQHKDITTLKDITTRNTNYDEDSIEPTTKKYKSKLKIHKLETYIKMPKHVYNTAINTENTYKETNIKTKHIKNNPSVNKNFIELEKVYYDNNYKVKMGNVYNVYEIPADKSPFIADEEPVTEQPYYVPIYNYAPNNAYFNPVNRLGPNPDDASQDDLGIGIFEELNSGQEFNDNSKTQNDEEFDSAFDIKRKKFGGNQKLTHIHKMPQPNGMEGKQRGKVNPEDYLDSDYYFGRVRKDKERRANHNNYDQFPNSNEHDHPTHSIQEMSLKDHVRAVRNILFQQKQFGLPERPGREILRSKKQKRLKPNKFLVKNLKSIARNGKKDSKSKGKDASENNIAIDYYYGRMKPNAVFTSDAKDDDSDNHFQKVGYIKNKNNTKELYAMDEFFKENVVKYLTEIQTKDSTYVKYDLKSATPHPIPKNKLLTSPKPTRKENITQFRDEEMKRNAVIMENFMKNQTENKFEVFANISPIEMKNDEKNASLKDKISLVRKEVMSDKRNSTTDQEMNLRLNRRNDVVKVGVYIQVLKDMISMDNKALKQYDWLGTSVDIQSAMQKLFDLIYIVTNEDSIHPGDLEILRYVLFLHKLATEIIQANDFGAQLRKKFILPRNKKRKQKRNMLKEKGLMNRVWLYLRREIPEIDEEKALKNLNELLMDIEDGLYNLHDTIKNIAKITKYKNQHWYQNLKELYLNTEEKRVLELLLHMTVSRLFELIEDSARNGLEDDYVEYMKNNKRAAKKTLEEMLFAIQILDEINKIVE